MTLGERFVSIISRSFMSFEAAVVLEEMELSKSATLDISFRLDGVDDDTSDSDKQSSFFSLAAPHSQ